MLRLGGSCTISCWVDGITKFCCYGRLLGAAALLAYNCRKSRTSACNSKVIRAFRQTLPSWSLHRSNSRSVFMTGSLLDTYQGLMVYQLQRLFGHIHYLSKRGVFDDWPKFWEVTREIVPITMLRCDFSMSLISSGRKIPQQFRVIIPLDHSRWLFESAQTLAMAV